MIEQLDRPLTTEVTRKKTPVKPAKTGSSKLERFLDWFGRASEGAQRSTPRYTPQGDRPLGK